MTNTIDTKRTAIKDSLLKAISLNPAMVVSTENDITAEDSKALADLTRKVTLVMVDLFVDGLNEDGVNLIYGLKTSDRAKIASCLQNLASEHLQVVYDGENYDKFKPVFDGFYDLLDKEKWVLTGVMMQFRTNFLKPMRDHLIPPTGGTTETNTDKVID